MTSFEKEDNMKGKGGVESEINFSGTLSTVFKSLVSSSKSIFGAVESTSQATAALARAGEYYAASEKLKVGMERMDQLRELAKKQEKGLSKADVFEELRALGFKEDTLQEVEEQTGNEDIKVFDILRKYVEIKKNSSP